MVSQGVRNCPSLSPIVAPPLDFGCYAKFSHRHAKLLHVGFLPLVFFLASLIGLATYCQAWQRAMKCLKTRILHVFELQLALPWFLWGFWFSFVLILLEVVFTNFEKKNREPHVFDVLPKSFLPRKKSIKLLLVFCFLLKIDY